MVVDTSVCSLFSARWPIRDGDWGRVSDFVPHREAAAYGPRLGGRGDDALVRDVDFFQPFE